MFLMTFLINSIYAGVSVTKLCGNVNDTVINCTTICGEERTCIALISGNGGQKDFLHLCQTKPDFCDDDSLTFPREEVILNLADGEYLKSLKRQLK